MHNTTRSPTRWAWRPSTSRDKAWRLALVVLVLAGLLVSCSQAGAGANRALDGVRDFGARFDQLAERFVGPIRDAVQGMASSLRGSFGRFVGRFPR
jgi:hypothetical protein